MESTSADEVTIPTKAVEGAEFHLAGIPLTRSFVAALRSVVEQNNIEKLKNPSCSASQDRRPAGMKILPRPAHFQTPMSGHVRQNASCQLFHRDPMHRQL